MGSGVELSAGEEGAEAGERTGEAGTEEAGEEGVAAGEEESSTGEDGSAGEYVSFANGSSFTMCTGSSTGSCLGEAGAEPACAGAALLLRFLPRPRAPRRLVANALLERLLREGKGRAVLLAICLPRAFRRIDMAAGVERKEAGVE